MLEEKGYAKSKMILYTVMIGTFMSMFDIGIVNVGLPVMASEFNESISSVHWVTSIYLLWCLHSYPSLEIYLTILEEDRFIMWAFLLYLFSLCFAAFL